MSPHTNNNSNEWIQAALSRLTSEMQRNSEKLDLIATTTATRGDLKELREEIIRNYVPLAVFETTITGMRDSLRDVRKEQDELKAETETAKHLALSTPEKIMTLCATIIGLLSGALVLFQHIKFF